MKWGRIFDGVIGEVIEFNPHGFFPQGFFVELPPEAESGDVFLDDELFPRPSSIHEFDFENRVWFADAEMEEQEKSRILAAAKAGKVAAIDARTTELISQGFTFANKQFSMSEAAQRNWIALSSGLANGLLPFPMAVSTIDESSHVLASGNELKAFLGAYLTYQADPSQPLGAGRNLKELVNACSTIEEVEAIVDDRS